MSETTEWMKVIEASREDKHKQLRDFNKELRKEKPLGFYRPVGKHVWHLGVMENDGSVYCPPCNISLEPGMMNYQSVEGLLNEDVQIDQFDFLENGKVITLGGSYCRLCLGHACDLKSEG